MHPFKTKKFKQLESTWYKKIADRGFKDIEESECDSEERKLNQWHSHYFASRHAPLSFEAQQTYYELASQFLHDHSFDSRSEREIWKLHSEGKSVRDIRRELKHRGYVKHSSIGEIQQTISKYRGTMLVGKWFK